jgi:arsenate reductase
MKPRNHLPTPTAACSRARTILGYLDESYGMPAATARITTHLPNLAIRFATERLAAVARNEGAVITGVPEVLLVGVHNAGRSQMAAASSTTTPLAGSTSAPLASPRPVRSAPPSSLLAEVGID